MHKKRKLTFKIFGKDSLSNNYHCSYGNILSGCNYVPGVQCPRGQQFHTCVDSCARSCQDLSREKKCSSHCVESCTCPAGLIFDHKGHCVPISSCPCVWNGLQYPAGHKEVRRSSKGTQFWYASSFFFSINTLKLCYSYLFSFPSVFFNSSSPVFISLEHSKRNFTGKNMHFCQSQTQKSLPLISIPINLLASYKTIGKTKILRLAFPRWAFSPQLAAFPTKFQKEDPIFCRFSLNFIPPKHNFCPPKTMTDCSSLFWDSPDKSWLQLRPYSSSRVHFF